MGFKSMNSYNDEKYGNFFRLQNDGDYADVIILYRNTGDVMMADAHYVKTNAYSGYVLCCGNDCPACAKGVRTQPKLFVPVFVLASSDPNGGTVGKVQFWDRSVRFQPQLVNDVFRGYPNPCEFVFRITRHGVAGSIETTYDIRAIRPNTDPNTSYDAICSRFGITFPDAFNTVCRDVNKFELGSMMSDTGNSYGSTPGYGARGYGSSFGNNNNNFGAVPRGGSTPSIPSDGMSIPGTDIPYTGSSLPTPNVPISAPTPDEAPDPNNLPFGDMNEKDSATSPEKDPLETDEDIDTTDLNF